jgi:hypothetical protein
MVSILDLVTIYNEKLNFYYLYEEEHHGIIPIKQRNRSLFIDI